MRRSAALVNDAAAGIAESSTLLSEWAAIQWPETGPPLGGNVGEDVIGAEGREQAMRGRIAKP